jgi:hypothetical protein
MFCVDILPNYEHLPSFPSALQLRVSFCLLNNQPPFLPLLHVMNVDVLSSILHLKMPVPVPVFIETNISQGVQQLETREQVALFTDNIKY